MTPQLDDQVPDTAFVDETDHEKFSPIRSVFPPPIETVGAGFGGAVVGGAVVGGAVAGAAVAGGLVVVGAAIVGGTVVGGVGIWPETSIVVSLEAAAVVAVGIVVDASDPGSLEVPAVRFCDESVELD